MKRWMKKIAVAFVAVITLGLYVPPGYMDAEAEEEKESIRDAGFVDESATSEAVIPKDDEYSSYGSDTSADDSDDHKKVLMEQAMNQTIEKLGPRILEKVEDELTDIIWPEMEGVLENVLNAAGKEVLPFYAITEQPAKGVGERIFHVYDFHHKKDVARFDVRRDNRPQEGYWFNFHYHLSSDNFAEHHEIGEIYWNKNVPPEWMS